MLRVLITVGACAVLAGLAPNPNAPPPTVPAPRFLQPASFGVEEHKPFALQFIDGEGHAAAWRNDRVRWAFTRVASTQTNADVATLDEKGNPVATLDLPGIAVVGADLKPRDLMLDAAAVRTFIEKRGSAEEGVAVPVAAERVRIRHVESFKTILRCGRKGAEAGQSEAMGESTQSAEIQAVLDPTALTTPTDLLVRLSAASEEVEDQRLIAMHVPTGRTVECTSRDGGYAHVPLDADGPWRLEFHALRAAPKGEEPALVLYSATLTFNVGPLPGEAK